MLLLVLRPEHLPDVVIVHPHEVLEVVLVALDLVRGVELLVQQQRVVLQLLQELPDLDCLNRKSNYFKLCAMFMSCFPYFVV